MIPNDPVTRDRALRALGVLDERAMDSGDMPMGDMEPMDGFEVGDPVRITNPHEPGHTTGVIAEVHHGPAYAVRLDDDGMDEDEPAGPHRWYVAEEMQFDDGDDATRALPDLHPGGEQLHHYWTKGEGLAKWAKSPHPWTALYRHLVKYVGSARAKRMAGKWFEEVFGFAAGSDLNRITHGKPPRGDKVGPG